LLLVRTITDRRLWAVGNGTVRERQCTQIGRFGRLNRPELS